MTAQTKTSKKKISQEVLKAKEESDGLLNERVNRDILATMAILNAEEMEDYSLNAPTVHFNPKDPSTYPRMDMSLCKLPLTYGMAGRRLLT